VHLVKRVSALKKEIKRLEAENKNLRQQITASAPARVNGSSPLMIPFASSSTISSNTATCGVVQLGFLTGMQDDKFTSEYSLNVRHVTSAFWYQTSASPRYPACRNGCANYDRC
jgi:hypothetical protein